MAAKPTSPVTTVALNEALLLGSLRQHELTEAAEALNARLEAEITARQQTARELAEKARLLDLTQDAIIVRGLDGHISYWNRGAEDLYGWSCEMALGKVCHRLLKTVFPVPLKQIMAELYRTGHWTGEMVHTKQDGQRVTVLVRKVLDRDDEGNPASVLENITDITERKRSEDALRESERRFRLALKNSPVSVAIQDRNLVYQWAYNQKSWRPDELIGKTDADLFAPEDMAWIKEIKQRVLESGKDVHVQHWVTSNGQRMFLDLTYEPLQDQDGEVTSIGIAVVDLTQQKLVEEALKASEERHRLLAETMLQGVVHQNASGTIIAMNPAAERILGKTREQFMGSSSLREEYQTIHEDGSSFLGFEHPAMVALQTGQTVREVVMGVFNPQLGVYRWISIDAVPLITPGENRPAEVYTVFEDITERKQAEEVLWQSEERLRLALQAARMATWDWDILTGQVIWNDEHYRMLGYEPQGVQPSYEAWEQRMHPDDRTKTEALLQSAMEQGTDYSAEFRVLHPDGTEHWLEARGQFERDASGHTVRCYGVMSDFTYRKRAEETLAAAHRQTQNIIDNTTAIVYAFDLEERFVMANVTVANLLNSTPAQMIGKRRHDFMPQADADWHEANDRKVIEAGRALGFEEQSEHPGHSITWLTTKFPLRDSEGNIYAVGGISTDISERKRAEEKISTLNQELENRVLERTIELQGTVTALESEIQNRHRLERGILEISEREQCRLGQDMHDGLGQELSGIAMLGNALTKELRTQSNPLAKDAGKLATYVRRALDSTRRLAKGLYPIELERHGLRLALKDLADQTSRLTRISCEVRHNGAEPKLEKSTEIHIYRIIQECIGNAVKHAIPKLIIIESHTDDGMHIFSVTNDGKGFTVPAGSSGIGLHLMHYRARLIHAELTIEQPETGGCRISCRLKEGDPKDGRP